MAYSYLELAPLTSFRILVGVMHKDFVGIPENNLIECMYNNP